MGFAQTLANHLADFTAVIENPGKRLHDLIPFYCFSGMVIREVQGLWRFPNQSLTEMGFDIAGYCRSALPLRVNWPC